MRTLTTAAAVATAFATIAFSSIASAQTPASQPDCDLESIHKAYWSMNGSTSDAALQQLEVEANKY
jgi:hypothetical protein